MRISDTSLSVRAKNALHKKGFQTFGQCVDLTEEKLFLIPFLGKKTVKEILKYFESDEFEKSLSDETNNIFSNGCEERFQYLVNILAIPLLDFPLSVRAENVLKKLKVGFLKDLVSLDYITILNVRDCGKKTFREIKTFLKKIELNLEMDLSADLKKEIDVQIENSEQPGIAIKNCKIKYPNIAVVFNGLVDSPRLTSRITFYKKCYKLYCENGTLESVAKIVGLTRERIRQILVKGTKMKLFKYRGHDYVYISKQKILNDFTRLRSLSKVAEVNKTSIVYIRRLLASYSIAKKDIDELLLTQNKKETITEYLKIKEKIGHYPTTTVLHANSKWRYIAARVQRYWGSFNQFRDELDIPAPLSFAEVTRPWIEHKAKLAFIKRMQDLDYVREILAEFEHLQTREIASYTRLRASRVSNLLKLLMATGEVIHEGRGSARCYRLSKRR